MNSVTITYEEWRKLLFYPDGPSFKRLVRNGLRLNYSDSMPIPRLVQWQTALADWLRHLKFFTDAQIYSIIQRCTGSLENFLQLDTTKGISRWSLMICDYRYVSWSGDTTFFDVQEEQVITVLPEMATTFTIVDLTALFLRIKQRYKIQQLSKETPHASDPENSVSASLPVQP